ncbi:MAG: hypothetical protein O7F73_02830 [Gammaproteobacteria bacterium]|nr:hypothetical protein [Gammaproteobacteria bacterium]
MNAAVPIPWFRTIVVVTVVALGLTFAFSGLRIYVWEALLPFFEWMETTWFGVIGQTWGAAFAVVEAFHLLAMALLGGAVLVSDARLLGLAFTELPARQVLDPAHRLFVLALVLALATGVFMACGVAIKIYYLPVFWFKMLALATGVLFVFFIKRPLLHDGIEQLNPWLVRLVAIASVMLWFTVAASGRWIGFSG